jgi:uncharacterized membrane protein (UPF0127 family)
MDRFTRVSLRDSAGKQRETGLRSVFVANTFITRLVGLLSRKSLASDEAMLIVPCKSIHTVGMKFTIDVVFLDKENKVLGVSSNVKPYQLRWAPRGTYSVLEVSDGNVNKTGIHLDDLLLFD